MAVWAEVARALAIFLAGYGAGMVTMAIWNRRVGDHVQLNRVLAVAILVVVTGGSLLGVWNSYQMREQAECQSRVNDGFLAALSANTQVNSDNRDNLDQTIERLAEDGDGADSQAVLDDYLEERDRIEEQREEYPPLPEEVCD